jgi:hypothetical protein
MPPSLHRSTTMPSLSAHTVNVRQDLLCAAIAAVAQALPRDAAAAAARTLRQHVSSTINVPSDSVSDDTLAADLAVLLGALGALPGITDRR